MELTGINIRMPTLTGKNYDTWKLRMRSVLVRNKLWAYVNGTKPKPVPASPDGPTAQEIAAIALWEEEDFRAISDLFLSISDGEMKQVQDCTTSREIWTLLESTYQSKAPARKASLWKKLATMKLSENGDPKAHVDEFFNVITNLEGMSLKLDDDLEDRHATTDSASFVRRI